MKSVKEYFILLFLLLLIFSPFSCKKDLLKLVSITPGTFTDTRDGRTYNTTTIGDYTWLAENLDFKTDSGSCYYDNDSLTNHEYGRLYTWQAAQAAVPPGWHLPTYQELKFLYDTLGGNLASYQMKEEGNSHWLVYYKGATNYSKLTILPGGVYIDSLPQFQSLRYKAIFWQIQQYVWGISDYWYYYNDTYNASKNMLSLRCVKNY